MNFKKTISSIFSYAMNAIVKRIMAPPKTQTVWVLHNEGGPPVIYYGKLPNNVRYQNVTKCTIPFIRRKTQPICKPEIK